MTQLAEAVASGSFLVFRFPVTLGKKKTLWTSRLGSQKHPEKKKMMAGWEVS